MNDRIVAGYAREKSDERDRFVGEAISDNAEELCRQLQDRLEGLSRIGGKLEKQNRSETSRKFCVKTIEEILSTLPQMSKLRV